jgi:hypothetical protein
MHQTDEGAARAPREGGRALREPPQMREICFEQGKHLLGPCRRPLVISTVRRMESIAHIHENPPERTRNSLCLSSRNAEHRFSPLDVYHPHNMLAVGLFPQSRQQASHRLFILSNLHDQHETICRTSRKSFQGLFHIRSGSEGGAGFVRVPTDPRPARRALAAAPVKKSSSVCLCVSV